ncbi:MAG: hypothetical protein ACI86H_000537 [bacterium]|jgi:hypothetical protein
MSNRLEATETKRVRTLNIVTLCIFLIFPVAGYFISGLDFAKGTLLGCVVVAINFYSTQKLMTKLLIEKTLHAGFFLFYILKMGVSVGILFLGIVQWKLDALGIMFGVSSIFVAILIFSVLRKANQ